MLLDCISAALLRRRHRCAGTSTGLLVPVRSFHLAFDNHHPWDIVAVDQWLFDVLRRGSDD